MDTQAHSRRATEATTLAVTSERRRYEQDGGPERVTARGPAKHGQDGEPSLSHCGGHLAYPLGSERMVSPSVLQLAYSQSTDWMVSRACPTAGGHLAYPLALRRMVSPSVLQLADSLSVDRMASPSMLHLVGSQGTRVLRVLEAWLNCGVRDSHRACS
jgi:hypothetical protein